MREKIANFLYDDRCPVCKTPIAVTREVHSSRCTSCGTLVEIDRAGIRKQDVVVFLAITVLSSFIPVVWLNIPIGVLLLLLWLRKSYRWKASQSD